MLEQMYEIPRNLDKTAFSLFQRTELVARRCFVKKVFLEISQYSQENTCSRVSFLLKLQPRACNSLLKKDSGTGVFRWFLRNFSEHLFLQSTSSGCFSKVGRFTIIKPSHLHYQKNSKPIFNVDISMLNVRVCLNLRFISPQTA